MYNNSIMKDSTILVAIVFLVVMFLSLWFSVTPYVPYSPDTLFSQQYPYEGFSQLAYTTTSNNSPLDDTYLLRSITPQPVDCKKVGGFSECGVFCNPSSPEQQVDIYSCTDSNKECIGNSSGLSNSKGALCLNANHIKLLQTRGGNASCGDNQIGKGN